MEKENPYFILKLFLCVIKGFRYGFDMHWKIRFYPVVRSMIIANNIGTKFERINCHNICLCQTK